MSTKRRASENAGTGVYRVRSPKTGEDYRVLVAAPFDGRAWNYAGASIARWFARFGEHVGTASLTHRDGWVKIDAHVSDPGKGIGVALYLACAVAAGDLGEHGIESRADTRSVDAHRLWLRFAQHKLSMRGVNDDGDKVDRLAADVAFATGFVTREPHLR